MAITIDKYRCEPRKATLPAEINLCQTLQSDQAEPEQVVIEHRLDAKNNVWFRGDDGLPIKSITRVEMIGGGGKSLRHTVLMIVTHELPNFDSVEIDETTTDAKGGKNTAVCALKIL